MYEEDQAQRLLVSLHSLLTIFKQVYEAYEIGQIAQEMRAMADEGEIQTVGPDLFQAAPPSAKRLTPEQRRLRGRIQQLWNVNGDSYSDIAAKLRIWPDHRVAQEIANMRKSGWRMLKHRPRGGLAEMVVPRA